VHQYLDKHELFQVGFFSGVTCLHQCSANKVFIPGGTKKTDHCLANVNSSSRSLYVIGRPSVCRLSVCNVGAPYSGDWNFPQYFYAMWYLGHPWPLYKNFTEIVPGEPPSRELNTRGVAEYNRKSHMGFRLVPNSVTLDDPERRNIHIRSVISPNSVAFRADYVKVVEDTPVLTAAEM